MQALRIGVGRRVSVDRTPMIMTRVILYVRNVDVLRNFYHTQFGLPVAEEIAGEWVVLTAGAVELALHLVGPPYRHTPADASTEPEDAAPDDGNGAASNAKLVFTITSGLPELRSRLVAAGVKMRDLKRYPGFPQLMCDGVDPEGNVFQLSQPDKP
jgi:hypothetical protein